MESVGMQMRRTAPVASPNVNVVSPNRYTNPPGSSSAAPNGPIRGTPFLSQGDQIIYHANTFPPRGGQRSQAQESVPHHLSVQQSALAHQQLPQGDNYNTQFINSSQLPSGAPIFSREQAPARPSHYTNVTSGTAIYQRPNPTIVSSQQGQPPQAISANGTSNIRATAELLAKMKQMFHSRDTYISHLVTTLTQQQREREELDFLFQQAQKEFSEGGRITSSGQCGVQKMNSPFVGMPPFYWIPSLDYQQEFLVEGSMGETVTKVRDFEDQGWVIPVSGSLRMCRGGVYKWSLLIVKKCQYRPQMQFGIHGLNHEKPWRLVTTSRCSRSRDDDPWQDRPDGDKLIDENDIIHVLVDLRGEGDSSLGTFMFAVNDEPFEKVFDDLPLTQPLIPVLSMGGDGSSVQLLKI